MNDVMMTSSLENGERGEPRGIDKRLLNAFLVVTSAKQQPLGRIFSKVLTITHVTRHPNYIITSTPTTNLRLPP